MRSARDHTHSLLDRAETTRVRTATADRPGNGVVGGLTCTETRPPTVR